MTPTFRFRLKSSILKCVYRFNVHPKMESHMFKMLVQSAFINAILFGGPSVFAKPVQDIPMEEPIPFESAYTQEQFEAFTKKVKLASKRSVAQTDSIDENTALSKQYMNIRNSIIGGPIYDIKTGSKSKTAPGIKTPEDVQTLLEDLNTKFKAGAFTEPDAKLLAAQLLMARPFRGFISRSRNIFETPSGNARMAHTTAVTTLRAMAAGLDTYVPNDDQWKAGFLYSVQPFFTPWDDSKSDICRTDAKWNETCSISNGTRFQAWLRKEVLPRVMDLNNVLASLDLSSKPIYVDNKIFFGKADFASSKDRFLRLGEAERLLLLSGTQAMLSSLYGIQAFKLDGLFESMDTVAKVYGFQTVFRTDYATAKDRFAAIRQHTNLFKFKENMRPVALTYLNQSYESLKTSMQNAHLAWRYLDSRESDRGQRDNLIDPRLVAPFQRILSTGFSNAMGIVGINSNYQEVAQGEVVSALYNGEVVKVNLKQFFVNPPSSLQDFMPTEFEGGNTMIPVAKYNDQYRNYWRGNPKAWNYQVYSRYFPEATSADGVKRTARVMAQSWGGFILGLPLALVVM